MELDILQHYWWILICILGGALVFLLFVQGGQSLLYTLGKSKEERDLIVNVIGNKWEYTFTTLVVFGGAFFASFPLFYATSFGGAYVVWMLILFCFVLQAVSYEYRNKKNNFLRTRTYEIFLMINGFAAPFLLGAAVATFFTGSPFRLGEMPRGGMDDSLERAGCFVCFHQLLLGFCCPFSVAHAGSPLFYPHGGPSGGPNAESPAGVV